MREFHGSEVVVRVTKRGMISKQYRKPFLAVFLGTLALLLVIPWIIDPDIPMECENAEDTMIKGEKDYCITPPQQGDDGQTYVTKYKAKPQVFYIILYSVGHAGALIGLWVVAIYPYKFRLGEVQYHKTVLTTKWDYDQYKRKDGDWRQK